MNKEELYNYCVELIKTQVNQLKSNLTEVQNSANNETKSSAGDKHETGRSMAQLETEKITKRLSEALQVYNLLSKVNYLKKSSSVVVGSLIYTNRGVFFLTVSLGKIQFKQQEIIVISALSPIGKLLLTKKENDSFSFNGINYVVEKIL